MKRRRSTITSEWPILERAGKKPDNWKGWPDEKQFALVLTHDVEFAKGQEKCIELMKIERSLGFKSSFNFVPERYQVDKNILKELVKNGFEIGVHGLNHDGKLFKNKNIFYKRAKKINKYLEDWNAVGFRSPAMHHNLEWIHSLNIEYDSSTFDTDPFEPQSKGIETIFPFIVYNKTGNGSYLELPYTLPQDHSVFIIFEEKNIDIWKNKLDWIVKKGGMALLNTHPDYMSLNGKPAFEEYSVDLYKGFLNYVKSEYEGKYWQALPKQVAKFSKTLG
jgi:peptidoglycan/xylan/chitin deacetylase (PgdA/CDA1 family)